MNITLTRYGSIPGKGTFGELYVDGMKFPAVEREWLDNKSSVSCIPDGKYKLVPHSSTQSHIGETWALVNEDEGIYHYANDKAIRYGILIHIANWQKDLEGCIGLGRNFGGSWNVTNSRHAMEYFRALLPIDQEHSITIRWQHGTS